jgi:integrase
MGVYLRGSVYWMRFSHNRKRYHLSCDTSDKREAERIEKEYRASLTGGPAPPESAPVSRPKRKGLTITAALERLWVEEWVNLRDGYGQYKRLLWLAEQLGDPLLREVDDTVVERAKRLLREGGRDVATINRYIAHLRKLMRTAKLVWKEPLELPYFRLQKENNGRTRIISHEEEEALMKAFLGMIEGAPKARKSKGDYADLLAVLLSTGMRLGEAVDLTWDHLNFDERLILLTPDITKSSKPRTIPMIDRAFAVFKRRKDQDFEKPFPFTVDQAEKAWQYARRVLGIEDPDFCWHSCRHTFASRLLLAGEDLYPVSKLLGHSNITVTERYSHLCIKQLRRAVDRINGEGVDISGASS